MHLGCQKKHHSSHLAALSPCSSLPQVELHINFDGAGRRSTLWEAIRRKGGAAAAGLPGDGSLRAFEGAVAVRRPKDLLHFLKSFGIFCSAYM